MKKFIDVKNGNEVKVGDKVGIMATIDLPVFGKVEAVREITLTKEVLNQLIKDGKVKVVNAEDHDNIWNAAIDSLVRKTGWKIEKLSNILETLENANPWAVTQIILREIAIELDKKYEDHINKSEHIYAVSPQDGRIHEINKAHIKNYRAFPAFRTVEDAKIACSLVRENLKSIFANA
jgi:hypothetical protein